MIRKLAIVCFCFLAVRLHGATNDVQTLDVLESKQTAAMASIDADYHASVQQALSNCVAALNQIEVDLKKNGDLDGVLTVRSQRDALVNGTALPDESTVKVLPSIATVLSQYHRAVKIAETDKNEKTADLLQKYVDTLKKLQADLVRSDKIDDAVQVKAELTKASFELVDSDSKAPPVAAVKTKGPIVLTGVYENRNAGRRDALARAGGGDSGTENAVLNALRWLKKYQSPDGSWDARAGGGPNDGDVPAMTGLALLAYLAHGETPASEEFGATVEHAIGWLVQNQQADGHFPRRDEHDYSHPIATYALCEAYGMTQSPKVKDAAKKALDVIIKGQHGTGSWNYNCDAGARNDTSYSGWCAQALTAAKNAKVDSEGLDRALTNAIAGFKFNFRKDVFVYETKEDVAHGRLTSTAVLCLQLLGAGKTAEARAGMNWLNRNATCDWSSPWGDMPMYHWYYVTQAKFNAGGQVWNTWNKRCPVQVTKNQVVLKGAGADGRDIGYWQGGLDRMCKAHIYSTALCTLMLEVYYRYPPTSKSP